MFGNIPNTLKVCKLHYDNKNSYFKREGGGKSFGEMAEEGIKSKILFLLIVGQVDMNIRVVFRHSSSFQVVVVYHAANV